MVWIISILQFKLKYIREIIQCRKSIPARVRNLTQHAQPLGHCPLAVGCYQIVCLLVQDTHQNCCQLTDDFRQWQSPYNCALLLFLKVAQRFDLFLEILYDWHYHLLLPSWNKIRWKRSCSSQKQYFAVQNIILSTKGMMQITKAIWILSPQFDRFETTKQDNSST